MKMTFLLLFTIIALAACNSPAGKKNNGTELITDAKAQTSIFVNLILLTHKSIPERQLNDSLAFLVLPVKLSCKACRKKTIDSIVKHQNDLSDKHFIIISGSEGRRNMNSYFQEVDKEMPEMKNQLFLDTTNMAYKKELVNENPVIYYAANLRVYKKVSASPSTVKDDLHEFFAGNRNVDLSKK